MDLWIRSQDRESLTKVSNVQYSFKNNIHFIGTYYDNLKVLGNYKSKERALEILDKIQECMETNTLFDLYSRTGVYPNDFNKKWNYVKVFQMPEE